MGKVTTSAVGSGIIGNITGSVDDDGFKEYMNQQSTIATLPNAAKDVTVTSTIKKALKTDQVFYFLGGLLALLIIASSFLNKKKRK